MVALFEQICGENTLFFSLYALPYHRVVARELSLGSVHADDHVLAVGCGALPFTAILTATLTGARVTGVDCDANAVIKARRLVEILGLSAQVSIHHGDAAHDLLPSADVALVALQASPKDKIHQNLQRSLPTPGGRIIYRLPRPGLEREYGCFMCPRENWRHTSHNMFTFDRSVLFTAVGA